MRTCSRLLIVVFTVLFVVLWNVTTHLFAQSTPPTLDPQYAQRLEHVCKVWGYLKYFHSGINAESRWDETLIRTLESVKVAKTNEEYFAAVESLISSAGTVQLATTPSFTVASALSFGIDYSWMRDSRMMSSTAIEALERVRTNFRPFQSHYIEPSPVGTPQARRESSYGEMVYPNEQYRLLSLFRYWNLIHYFFPYKDTLDKPWEQSLRLVLPYFVHAQKGVEYYQAVCRLAAQIQDSHGFINSSLFSVQWGYGALPTEFEFTQGMTVISRLNYTTTVLKNSGTDQLKVGDILVAIDSVPIDKVRARIAELVAASNPSSLNRDINNLLRYGDPYSSYRWRIRRGTQELDVVVKPLGFNELSNSVVRPPQASVKWSIMDNNIGYVNMGILEVADVPRMMDSLKNTRAIVFDVRNYPRGTMYEIGKYLTDPVPFVTFTAPSFTNPGVFQASVPPSSVNARLSAPNYVGSRTPVFRYGGKKVALMNATTQSHAEFTCMSLQAAGTTLIGSQTAGADGNIARFMLPGNIQATYTSLGVFYPDGKSTQRIGIVPDIAVVPTQAGIAAGRDEVLERAVKHILGERLNTQECTQEYNAILAPNPSASVSELRFTVQQATNVDVRIVNTLGQAVRTFRFNARAGANTIPLDVAMLGSGVYYCFLQSSGISCQTALPLVISR